VFKTIIDYFNLNKPLPKFLNLKKTKKDMENTNEEKVDIFYVEPEDTEDSHPDNKKLSIRGQITMFFGVFIGVLFSTVVKEFRSSGSIDISIPTLRAIVISTIVALIIIPGAYKNIELDKSSPFIIQFGLFVQHGVFWDVAFDLFGK